jgi:hypothetical protein
MARRKILSSFMRALDDIASGNYDLNQVAGREAGVFEQVKDSLNRGYSDWYKDATRGEVYLKEMLRQRDIGMGEELTGVFRPVLDERATRIEGLSRMINDVNDPNTLMAARELDELDTLGMRAEVESLWGNLPLGTRFQLSDQISRVGGFEALPPSEMRKLLDYVRKNIKKPPTGGR